MGFYVGIIGQKQAGKDTLANYLFQEYGNSEILNLKIDYMAKSLKDTCANLLGVDEKLLYGTNDDKEIFTKFNWEKLPIELRLKYADRIMFLSNKEIAPIEKLKISKYETMRYSKVPREGKITVRNLLQIIGTDIFRNYFDKNVHINSFLHRNSQIKKTNNVVIASDIRFMSEINGFLRQDVSSYFIFLTRAPYKDSHESEKGFEIQELKNKLGQKLFVIDNKNMTIEEQNEETKKIMDKILKKERYK